MPTYLLLRVLSILLVVVIAWQSPNQRTFTAIVYSITFAHFLMAFLYSRRQYAELVGSPTSALALFSLVVVGVAIPYLFHVPLLIYFAIHHALNEAYIVKTGMENDSAVGALRGSAVLLHLFLYLFLLRRTTAIGYSDISFLNPILRRTGGALVSPRLLLIGLVISYVLFFYYLYRARPSWTLRTLGEACGLEILGLGAVVASYYLNFKFLWIVLYHIVFWTFFPLPRILAQGSRSLLTYLGLTAASVAGFLALSPIGAPGVRVSALAFQTQFMLWSYVHITVSFALSNANPRWIVDLFRPARPSSPPGPTAWGPAPPKPQLEPLQRA